jgi:2-polyprenyl-3-methyl-5-hydroxy-6-metoxy-1,4-benzoquinol methylase
MLERFDPTRESENPCYQAFSSYQTGLYERAREAIQGLGRPSVRMLDAACGIGYGSTYLADLGSYEGLDADRETVERARARWPGATYSVADLDDPGAFAGREGYDAIMSFETAEHLREPGAFLRRCRGALGPGGMLCFSAPTGWTKDFDPYHRRDWSAGRWERVLGESGFGVTTRHEHQIDESFASFRTMIPVSAGQHAWAGWRAARFGYLGSRIREWLIEGRFRCRWTMWTCTKA